MVVDGDDGDHGNHLVFEERHADGREESLASLHLFYTCVRIVCRYHRGAAVQCVKQKGGSSCSILDLVKQLWQVRGMLLQEDAWLVVPGQHE